jgi:hypothetical protein
MALLDNNDVIAALQEELRDVEETRPDPHHIVYKKGWRPKLNPIQKKAVASKAIYKLYYGERGTGKGHGAIHEVVDYLYRNDNALGYIIVKEIGMGTEGGAWHKLKMDVMPEWEEGLGIQVVYGTDFQTKSPYVWISNRHGGWSCAILKSMPVAEQVEMKIRGREPDIVFIDEAQALKSDTYFTSLLMQLGRRRGAKDPSKIIFVCNPEGPSHWLYIRFFLTPVDEETGTWDARYAHFHIPFSDNRENLPANYYENYVLPAVKNDPIAKARLVDGQWVDRQTGDSLFSNEFVEAVHVKGDITKNQFLLPVVGIPFIISWDPGAANTVVYFEQLVSTATAGVYLLVLDELDWVGEYTPFKNVVKEVIQKQLFWEKRMDTQFQWIHISDSSAFTMFRPNTGSFDVKDIEKLSVEYITEHALEPRFSIKMRECPKRDFSIDARVRMIKDDLISNRLMLSAMCRRGKEMFLRMPADPDNMMVPKKKTRYVHTFDAMTYGPFYFRQSYLGVPGKVETVEPQCYGFRA